jgi:hypothetical protein
MGVPGLGPAPHINLDEFGRRLREGVQSTGPNDAPSKLPRIIESSSPDPALSRYAPNTLERARTGKESTEPLDVRSLPQLHLTPETSIAGAEDPRALDVDDFRKWWQKRLAREAAEDRSRGRKLTLMPIVLAGIALASFALALKGGAPTPLQGPSFAPPSNDAARAQNLSGETAGTSADISSMLSTGGSGATPVAPEVDAQAVEGLPSKPSAQTTEPEPVPRVSVRPEGTQIASQVSSAVERGFAADAPKPPAKPASERMTGAGQRSLQSICGRNVFAN